VGLDTLAGDGACPFGPALKSWFQNETDRNSDEAVKIGDRNPATIAALQVRPR
jgi:hypothetical protein